MRREVVAAIAAVVVLVVAMLPAQGSPGPSNDEFLPHEPIYIGSNANFTTANGVIAGSGTPADPFVIAGWHIRADLGAAILVHNTTAAFVIRDNNLEGYDGISVRAAEGPVYIHNNKIFTRNRGIYAREADPIVWDNAVIGPNVWRGTGTGIYLEQSNGAVLNNSLSALQWGIVVDAGSYNLSGNDIHHVSGGIYAHFAVASRIEANVVTKAESEAIHVEFSQHVGVYANVVTTVGKGILLLASKDVDVRGNSVTYTTVYGVLWERTSGNFTLNVVIDGKGDGVQAWQSPVVMVNNTVQNNLGIGMHFSATGTLVEGNLLTNNGIGIAAYSWSVLHLRQNVMANNSIGLDIPYDGRQTITWMEANYVNGINVDGTVNPSQRSLFYMASNVTVNGALLDSGFSAGYYGSISAQGQLVLYDTDTATITGSTISHGAVGVGVFNSFNVVVSSSTLSSNRVGVRASSNAGITIGYGSYGNSAIPPPACVVSVKDTNITIPVDPPATIGIDIGDCFAIVTRVNVSLVDYGVKVAANGRATITGSTITSTRIGLDIAGKPGEIEVRGNALVANRIGARFASTVGLVADNHIANNTEAGVRLEAGAKLQLRGNNFTANAAGLVDTRACGGAYSCSSVNAESNVFWRNGGDGAYVQGTSTWRGDIFLQNQGTGLRTMSAATLHTVVSTDNTENGVQITGGFEIRNSAFERNGANGAHLRGSGVLRASDFRHNELAGIQLSAIYTVAVEINVSHNFDGILFDEVAETAAAIISLVDVSHLLPNPGMNGVDPLDVHRSHFIGNTRDAIRAGAAVVNATYNYWGSETGAAISIGDELGAYRNGVSPYVRTIPYYTNPQMTTTGPLFVI